MQRIHLLSKDLANKIAAGEVVENPASAIKELIENSIDAEAQSVDITYADATEPHEFSVRDDGKGMGKEDLLLSMKRHATSKIQNVDDLFKIGSLGFRGEALASIASVSEVIIQSIPEGEEGGHSLHIDRYGETHVAEHEGKSGTQIRIRDLFFNTPARKKYLRSKNAEYAAVLDIVTKYALIYPTVSFTFRHNESIVFETKGNGNLLESIAVLYGLDVAKHAIPFSLDEDTFHVEGFIGSPQFTRATKQLMHFYVNKRYIKSTTLTNAVLEGYSNLIMDHRYPVCFLNVTVDTTQVDVNIHPSKRIVKLENEKRICSLLTEAVQETLTEHQSIPQSSESERKRKESQYTLVPEEAMQTQTDNVHSGQKANSQSTQPRTILTDRQKEFTDVMDSAQSAVDALRADFKDHVQETSSMNESSGKQTQQQESVSPAQQPEKKDSTPKQGFLKTADDRPIRILGQLNKLYILCELEDSLLLIDQHAAEERINYEYFMDYYSNKKSAQQELINPLLIELSGTETEYLHEYWDVFTSLGFAIEEYGKDTFKITSVPVILGDVQLNKQFFSDLLDEFSNEENFILKSTLYEKVALRACKASIRSGDTLTTEGMKRLIQRLFDCKNPYACAHGRPTMIEMSSYELDKKFKRIV